MTTKVLDVPAGGVRPISRMSLAVSVARKISSAMALAYGIVSRVTPVHTAVRGG